MPCVAIKSFGDLAVVATVVFVGLVGVWLLMWPVISFMLKMVDMIQLPEEKDLTEYKTLLDIWTDTTGYINLITDSVTCKEYLERKKRFDKYKKIIYPKAFKFIKKDSNGLLGKLSLYILLLSMVCVVGQIFAILLMVQNEDIRDTYKDKGTNGITQPQFIVINTILTFFGGVSVILHALLYNVKGAMDPLQHFVAKLALIGVFLVGFVFLFIYYPFLILSTILALAYAGALIGIVFFSPLGWILIYHVASIVPMIRDRVKENMDNDRDLDEDIIDYTSDTFFYGCVAALATGWAVVFVAFCITVEVAGPFRESNVCLEYGPLQNITGIILSISAAVGLTKDNVLKWFKKKFCGKKNSDQALCGGFKGHILNCRECGEVIKVRKNKVRYVVCNQDHITDCAPISTTGTTNDNTPPDNL